jgi:hypothetical protein
MEPLLDIFADLGHVNTNCIIFSRHFTSVLYYKGPDPSGQITSKTPTLVFEYMIFERQMSAWVAD